MAPQRDEGNAGLIFLGSKKKPAGDIKGSLEEGISLLLSRWNGLQMAIQNQWGGRDSMQKSHQLAAEIHSWFSQSKAQLQIEELENWLHETMLLSFNTDIEDGSIEEIAEQLMVMHEEYWEGNH